MQQHSTASLFRRPLTSLVSRPADLHIRRGILRFVLALAAMFFLNDGQCQVESDLENIRVDELSESQIRQFINEANRFNLSEEQIGRLAIDRGMSPTEVSKLKDRIKITRRSMSPAETQRNTTTPAQARDNKISDSISASEKRAVNDYTALFNPINSRNFGADVFNNPRITFEPNLRIPTPANYTLAADDELLIDVSGYSEAEYRLKVSPEGVIRIPVAGPVMVNGLTIEQAKRAIVKKLASTIYSNIRQGNTHVDVTLGAVRSIRVSVIGEATVPGTYTLSSLSSVYNALYASAGPNTNGSYRNIQLIRNNAVFKTIDVYQFLVNGNKKNDVRLMDQDVVRINTYDIRVELKGEVKKPGLYDVLPGESLGQVIGYAGGFTDNAYTDRIQVFSNTTRERKVGSLLQNMLDKTYPKKGDSYLVGKILSRYSNRVTIRGAVYRPGEYELRDGITLSQLLKEADGLREDAFTSRATIHRLKPDLSPELVAVDLDKLLNGSAADIPLRKDDRVEIYSRFDLKEGYFIRIDGEVATPGLFLYEQGITIQDLVMQAGGLKESASVQRVEISRRVKNGNPLSDTVKTALIFRQDIRIDMRDSGLNAFVLQPFDEVTVRPAPGYFTQKNVVIEGEVVYKGKYTLEGKNDRISDLVKRAGGFTPEAYLKGAVLVRTKNLSKTEQANNEQGLSNLMKQNYQAGSSLDLLRDQWDRSTKKKSENVGINMEKIMAREKSKYDLLLNDGDTLRIPRQLQTVRVNGEVLYPALVRYDRNMKFKDYVIGAGGFSERSSKRRSYAVFANGSVKGTRSFLFFKNYPSVTPGAEIYIPMKREKERLRTGEIVSIASAAITLGAVLITVFRR